MFRDCFVSLSIFYPWFLSMWSMATASSSTTTTPPLTPLLPSAHTHMAAQNADTTAQRFQTMVKSAAGGSKWITDGSVEDVVKRPQSSSSSSSSSKRKKTQPFFGSTFQEVIGWKQIDIEYPSKRIRDAAIKSGRFIAENNLPLGLHVYRSRIFVTLPKWKEGVPITLGVVRRGEGRSPAIKPYPDWSWHKGDSPSACDGLTSVFRIDIDVCNRLWVLDSGVVDAENTVRQMCPPQIFVFDLETDKLLHRYAVPRDQSPDSSLLSNIVVEVLLQQNHHNNGNRSGGESHSHGRSHSHNSHRSHTPHSSYTISDRDRYSSSSINHDHGDHGDGGARLDHRGQQHTHNYRKNRGASVASNKYDCIDAYAYLGDVFRYGLIVYSYKTNRSWRVTHSYFYPDPLASDYVLDGIEFQWVDGLFGMALSPVDPRTGDDRDRLLYFHPLSSYREFSVPTYILRNESLGFAMTKFFRIVGQPRGEAVSHSTGSGISNNGILFYNLLTKSAVACWNSNLQVYDPSTQHVLYQDNATMSFPNDLRVDLEPEQSVWVLSNRLHRFLYDRLDPNDVNFRILSAPVDDVVRGTVCDPSFTSYISVEDLNNDHKLKYHDPW